MRALRLAFLAAGLGFLALMCARTLDDGSSALPGWPRLLGAAVLAALGLAAATAAWVRLAARPAPAHGRPGAVPDPRALAAGFLAAQLGKYIPGGVWIGAAHMGFGMGAGLTARQAAGTLVVYSLCLIAAAGAVAGGAGWIAAGAVPWPRGVALALPFLLPLLLARRGLAWLAECGGRILPDRVGTIELPSQAAILACFGLLVPSVAASALGYAALLRGLGVELTTVGVVAAFAVAWLAGFLALGFPSGLGAREAGLALFIPAGTGAVLAASVVHRLVQAGVEVAFLVAARRYVPGPTARAEAGVSAARPGPARSRTPHPHRLEVLMSAFLARLPNLLSATRVALVPVLWVLALRGHHAAVGVGLVLASVTDILDGRIARAVGAVTPAGAALDSLGDNLLLVSGVAWLGLLRPDVAAYFAAPILVWLALYACFIGLGAIRLHRFANLHLNSSRAAAIAAYVFVIWCFLIGGMPVALGWLAFGMGIASVLEGIGCQVASRDVDEHAGSLVNILRQRRLRSRGEPAERRPPPAVATTPPALERARPQAGRVA